jgi:hypothetical protein
MSGTAYLLPSSTALNKPTMITFNTAYPGTPLLLPLLPLPGSPYDVLPHVKIQSMPMHTAKKLKNKGGFASPPALKPSFVAALEGSVSGVESAAGRLSTSLHNKQVRMVA